LGLDEISHRRAVVEICTHWRAAEFIIERDKDAEIEFVADNLCLKSEAWGFHAIQVTLKEHTNLKVNARNGYWVAAEPAQQSL